MRRKEEEEEEEGVLTTTIHMYTVVLYSSTGVNRTATDLD